MILSQVCTNVFIGLNWFLSEILLVHKLSIQVTKRSFGKILLSTVILWNYLKHCYHTSVKVIHLQTCRSFWLKNIHDFNKFTASICCSSFSLCLQVDTVHRFLVILPKAMPRYLPKIPVGQFLLFFAERQKMYPPKENDSNWSLPPPREPKGEYKVTSGCTVSYQGEPAKPAGKFQENSLETTRKRIAAMLGRKS